MTYFNNIHSLEELRKEYKRLVKLNHPDNGGNEETIKAINAEYDKMFDRLKDADTSTNNNSKTANRYNKDIDAAIREAINRIIHLEGIQIDLVGTWVWVFGNSYPVKDQLKAAGFRYSGNRKAWYWHSNEEKKKGASKRSMDELKAFYGCQTVEKEKKEKLTA